MDSEKTAPSHRVIRYLLDRRRPGSQKSRIGNEILKKLTSGSVPGASRDPPDASRSYLELRGVSGADLGPKNPFPISKSSKNQENIMKSAQDRSCSALYSAKKSIKHNEIPQKAGSAHPFNSHSLAPDVAGCQRIGGRSVPGASRDPPDTSRSHFRLGRRIWDLKIHSQYPNPQKINKTQ